MSDPVNAYEFAVWLIGAEAVAYGVPVICFMTGLVAGCKITAKIC